MHTINKYFNKKKSYVRLEPYYDVKDTLNDSIIVQDWISSNESSLTFPEDVTSAKCRGKITIMKQSVDQSFLKIVGSKYVFSQSNSDSKTKLLNNTFKGQQVSKETGDTNTSKERVNGTKKNLQAIISKVTKLVVPKADKLKLCEETDYCKAFGDMSSNIICQDNEKKETSTVSKDISISKKMRCGHLRALKFKDNAKYEVKEQVNFIGKGQVIAYEDLIPGKPKAFKEIKKKVNFKSNIQVIIPQERDQTDTLKYPIARQSTVTTNRKEIAVSNKIQNYSSKEKGSTGISKYAKRGLSNVTKRRKDYVNSNKRILNSCEGKRQTAVYDCSKVPKDKKEIANFEEGHTRDSKLSTHAVAPNISRPISPRKKSTSITKDEARKSKGKVSTSKGKSDNSSSKKQTPKRKESVQYSSKKSEDMKNESKSVKKRKCSEKKLSSNPGIILKTDSKRRKEVANFEEGHTRHSIERIHVSALIPPLPPRPKRKKGTSTKKDKARKSKGKVSTSKRKSKSPNKKQTPKRKKSAKNAKSGKKSSGTKKKKSTKKRKRQSSSKKPDDVKNDSKSVKKPKYSKTNLSSNPDPKSGKEVVNIEERQTSVPKGSINAAALNISRPIPPRSKRKKGTSTKKDKASKSKGKVSTSKTKSKNSSKKKSKRKKSSKKAKSGKKKSGTKKKNSTKTKKSSSKKSKGGKKKRKSKKKPKYSKTKLSSNPGRKPKTDPNLYG